MQPLHVDYVNNLASKNVLSPPPNKYNLPRTFGNSGLNKSFGGPDNYEEVRLKRQSKMPGPGMYGFTDQVSRSLNLTE